MARGSEQLRKVGDAVYRHPGRVVVLGLAIWGACAADIYYTDSQASDEKQEIENSLSINPEMKKLKEEGVIFFKPDHHTQYYPAESGDYFIDGANLVRYNNKFDPDVTAEQATLLAGEEYVRQELQNDLVDDAINQARVENISVDDRELPITHNDFMVGSLIAGAIGSLGGSAIGMQRNYQRNKWRWM
jgi:hypothetical protein